MPGQRAGLRVPNRLIHESSPYLLQHAHNPVDWYPWGEEALRRAREEDSPVLLSIGYAACHWCHVMEHESFENPAIAQMMNELFINIKVDREERPDLDSIYMQAVQAMTGRGGWPMTVFLTPQGAPFYGGTYFPPEDRGGLPAFPRVLQAVSQAYRHQRGEVAQASARLVATLQRSFEPGRSLEPLSTELLQQAYQNVKKAFDPDFGGFGQAPKFPQSMIQEFLLRYHHRTGDAEALGMVEATLQAMAHGGIYDQLGGGFHRYATDALWQVPHFEKMLYDNALLSRLTLHAYQITGRPLYRRLTEETLDYVLQEMTDPSGGFSSTQDADSEGQEGKFYLWRPDEVMKALGEEDGKLFCRYYGVTEAGNLEGGNVLHVAQGLEELSATVNKPPAILEEVLARGRRRLQQQRQRRVAPAKDTKVITAWNGMMLRSLAEAAGAFRRDDYLRTAQANAAFLLGQMRPNSRLLRTWKDGQAKLKGYLEDYALLADGLLALYEVTFEARWFQEARTLADAMLELFWDPLREAFYDTGRDHEELVVRPQDFADNATPSGSSTAAGVLLRLALFTGEDRYRQIGSSALRGVRAVLGAHPTGVGHWLCALDFYLSIPKEVVLIGRRDDPGTQELLHTVFRRFLPNKVVAGAEPGSPAPGGIPLLEGRGMLQGKPTAYVCQYSVCQLPVTGAEALAQQL